MLNLIVLEFNNIGICIGGHEVPVDAIIELDSQEVDESDTI